MNANEAVKWLEMLQSCLESQKCGDTREPLDLYPYCIAVIKEREENLRIVNLVADPNQAEDANAYCFACDQKTIAQPMWCALDDSKWWKCSACGEVWEP